MSHVEQGQRSRERALSHHQGSSLATKGIANEPQDPKQGNGAN